jgi:catechol 2,3-dioxygenase-like lactoylglutathione lyase family enzyme
MEVKELGHLVLYVRDLNASAHFYRDVLGWQPIFDLGRGFRLPRHGVQLIVASYAPRTVTD